MNKKAYLIIGIMWIAVALGILISAADGPTIERSRVALGVVLFGFGSFFTGIYVGGMK